MQRTLRRRNAHEGLKSGRHLRWRHVHVHACPAWETTEPIEIIVPAGTGGGADQMARVMQGIIAKHDLSKQSVVVINESGGAGGEEFLDVKNSRETITS